MTIIFRLKTLTGEFMNQRMQERHRIHEMSENKTGRGGEIVAWHSPNKLKRCSCYLTMMPVHHHLVQL